MLKNPVNEALVVKIATQYSEQLTPEELIKCFETAKMVSDEPSACLIASWSPHACR